MFVGEEVFTSIYNTCAEVGEQIQLGGADRVWDCDGGSRQGTGDLLILCRHCESFMGISAALRMVEYSFINLVNTSLDLARLLRLHLWILQQVAATPFPLILQQFPEYPSSISTARSSH